MSIELDIQRQVENKDLPSDAQFMQWAQQAILQDDAEVSIQIVDKEKSQQFNNDYRKKNKPTNVLSFEMQLPEDIDFPLQGDLIICADIVEEEAIEQKKTSMDHWAHMVIHGLLHLQAYDHLNDEQALKMESLEIKLLKNLGINNPYGMLSI